MKIVICPECGAEVKIPADGVHVEKIRVCLKCDRKLVGEARRVANNAAKPFLIKFGGPELARRRKTNAA